jgi:hypothetical protein
LDFDCIPPSDGRNNEAMRVKRKLPDGNLYAFTEHTDQARSDLQLTQGVPIVDC